MNIFNKYYRKYSTLSNALKAGLWFTFANFFQRGISVITVPIFTRILTPEEYGVYNVFQSWLSIVTIFATLSLTSGVFNNGMVKFEKNRDQFTSSIQSLTTIITTLTLGIYLININFWNNITGLTTFLTIVMFLEIYFMPALSYWTNRQRFEFEYGKVILVTILIAIVNPLIGILAVLHSRDGATARILSAALVQIVIGAILYTYNFYKGKTFWNKEYWKFCIAFNIPLIPHYLAGTVLNQADRIMINNYIGAREAGIYSLAYSTAMLMQILQTSINQSFIPWVYNILKEKKFHSISSVTNFLLTIYGAGILILIALAPEAISILGSEEYFEAIWVVPPVALSVFFIFLFSLCTTIELYYEKNIRIMFESVIGAILNVILNVIFIPRYGYLAAGYTTLFSYIIYSLCHYTSVYFISKNELNGARIYDGMFIVKLSFGLTFTSGLLMFLYDYFILRYAFILIMFLVLFLKRNTLINKFKSMKS